MCWLRAAPSARADNFYNITRNFAFVGIMALGMTAVIITGGIDLSVGSIIGVVGVALRAGAAGGAAVVAGRAWSGSSPASSAAPSTAS